MLEFDEFISIINSLFSSELQRQLILDRRLQVSNMVFGDLRNANNYNNGDDNEEDNVQNRWQMIRMANCMKILGKGVIRVVNRVDEAKENNNLDLSDCQLMQVPDAIYFMMKDNPLATCNLSSNVITKIPAKFPIKFSLITELNLSNNRVSALPEEIKDCHQLERVDISYNSFIAIPNCLFNLPKLAELIAKRNYVADVDVELLTNCPSITALNLEKNPLSRECHEALQSLASVTVKLTPKEIEEWEDLTI